MGGNKVAPPPKKGAVGAAGGTGKTYTGGAGANANGAGSGLGGGMGGAGGAKKFGGGGNKKASGFTLPGDAVVDDIFDDIKLKKEKTSVSKRQTRRTSRKKPAEDKSS